MKEAISLVLPTKEVNELKPDIESVKKTAIALTIENDADMEKAADILHILTKIEKAVLEKKETVTRPLMKALSAARDLFKPLENDYTETKKSVKAKMLAYQIEKDEKIQKEKDRIAARVEKGTMRGDTAVKKMEEIGETGKATTGSVGRASVRTVRKVRIIDPEVIPREYMVPDLTKITEAVIRNNAVIPGVEVYEEKSMVAR